MNLRLIGFILLLTILNVVGCVWSGKMGHDGIATSDCMSERKSIDTILISDGSIIKVSDQFILLSNDGNQRYLACNLPESYKKEGQKMTCLVVVKEIFPNERWMATPAYIQEIKSSNP